MVYVRTPDRCIEVFKKNANWKKNGDLMQNLAQVLKYKPDLYNTNVDTMFTLLRDTEQLKIRAFYIENARVCHEPDALLTYCWSYVAHWKDNNVSFPLLHAFYNDTLWKRQGQKPA